MFKSPFNPFVHVLDRGTQITGTLRFSKRLLLIGSLQGELIGEGPGNEVLVKGTVTGPVTVGALIVEGTVEGDVNAHEVIVHAGGVIRGKLRTDVLHLLKGGQVEGEVQVRTITAKEPAARREGSATQAKARLQQVTGGAQSV